MHDDDNTNDNSYINTDEDDGTDIDENDNIFSLARRQEHKI